MFWVRMTMGVGILTLPNLIKDLGLVYGAVALILGCAICYFSYTSIFMACVQTQIKEYSEIVNKLLPSPIATMFKFTYFLDMMCFLIVYSIFGWRILEFLMNSFGLMKDEWFINKSTLEVKEYDG